jgi:hypothetical protein
VARTCYRRFTIKRGLRRFGHGSLLFGEDPLPVVVLANGGDVPAREALDRILSLLLPAYRQNRAKAATPGPTATPPAATNASAVPQELVGPWSGEIQTHGTKVPLVLTVTSNGETDAMLGKAAAVKMTNVRLDRGRVTGRVAGTLDIDYAERVDPAPHEVRFQLWREGDRLIGAAITYDYPAASVLGWAEAWRRQVIASHRCVRDRGRASCTQTARTIQLRKSSQTAHEFPLALSSLVKS